MNALQATQILHQSCRYFAVSGYLPRPTLTTIPTEVIVPSRVNAKFFQKVISKDINVG